jgi:RNA polymerase sigma factor (sigma-70 family)
MDDRDWLAQRFEANRPHLRAVAYRLLGSFSEADDAVQETWLHLSRADPSGVDNLGRWLTTVVARVCLDLLRSRTARREELLGVHLPDPIIRHQDALDPEQEALLAEGVGLALLVVMEQLAPAERLALVLHDTFAVPFEEIAAILGRSRNGDLDALVAVLDPDVVVRADWGRVPAGASRTLRGPRAVAKQALTFAQRARSVRPALVNGTAGVVADTGGRLLAVMGFTVRRGKIVEIDILADPARLRRFDLPARTPGAGRRPACIPGHQRRNHSCSLGIARSRLRPYTRAKTGRMSGAKGPWSSTNHSSRVAAGPADSNRWS